MVSLGVVRKDLVLDDTSTQEVRDCVESISWFAGLANSAADSDATELQHRSIEAIRGAVRERAVNGRAQLCSKHEAVRALLQGGPV